MRFAFLPFLRVHFTFGVTLFPFVFDNPRTRLHVPDTIRLLNHFSIQYASVGVTLLTCVASNSLIYGLALGNFYFRFLFSSVIESSFGQKGHGTILMKLLSV